MRFLLIAAVIALVVGIALEASGNKPVRRIEWEGLCIPAHRVTTVSGSLLGQIFSQMKLDKEASPTIFVDFSSQELSHDIPGYIPNLNGQFGTNMGVTLELQPLAFASKPHGEAYLGQGYKDLWRLTGYSTGSAVKKIPGTGIYRVTAPRNQKYNDFFELVWVDLRKKNRGTVPPLKEWYVGSCGENDELGYTCDRELLTQKFYVDYNFAKPNISKIRVLDRFFIHKLSEWEAACR